MWLNGRKFFTFFYQKMCQITILNLFTLSSKDEDSDLAHLFEEPTIIEKNLRLRGKNDIWTLHRPLFYSAMKKNTIF